MPTIKDVANRAGVSAMTVSRVINDASNVSPATRRRVREVIDELGYVRSGAAKSLRSKRTHTLALVVPDNANAFWTTVARGVEDAAQARGYSVLLCNTDENIAKQQRYLDVIVGQQVDGVIIAPCDSDAQNLARLRDRGIPTVALDRTLRGWEVDTVIGDSVSGAWALTRHLIALGHQQIALLAGPPTTSTAVDRVLGYRYALADAGLPYDPRLVKEGEYRAVSGQRLTQQLLDGVVVPTAIFASNNALMLGALNALANRGLRVPQEMALVAFGDLPNTSRLFPFLTVADLPSYEMGVNAAQLLFSRLEGGVSLKPRFVVLPSRLVVRRSCGTRLEADEDGAPCLSWPLPHEPQTQVLVETLAPAIVHVFSERLAGVSVRLPPYGQGLPDSDTSDAGRLLSVLRHREADRVPYLELRDAGQAAYEYILQQEMCAAPTPKEQVEFAQRVGIDAVICRLAWQGGGEGRIRSWIDLAGIEPAPSLAEQLGILERYLHAVRGTRLGVIVSVPSPFAGAVRLVAVPSLEAPGVNRDLLESVMDLLLDHAQNTMRAICDRFSADLALVVVEDDPRALPPGLGPFTAMYARAMERLITPAKEHGKLVVLSTKGGVEHLLPLLHEVGFDAVHPGSPGLDNLTAIRKQWAGRLAVIGGFPDELLERGSPAEIEAQVRAYCIKIAPGGGYVLGTSSGPADSVPPENWMAMVHACRRYGRYGSLGDPTPAPGWMDGSIT